jgi:hypothetical protein
VVLNPGAKPVIDTDVFGLILDASGEPVLPNRTRVGSIGDVPPGSISTMRITDPRCKVSPASRSRPSVSSLLSAGTLAVVQMRLKAASPDGIGSTGRRSSLQNTAFPLASWPVTMRRTGGEPATDAGAVIP